MPILRPTALVLLVACAAAPVAAQQTKRPPRKPAAAPQKPKPEAAKLPAPPPPPPDLAIAARYTTGEKVTTSTVALHAARERIGYDSELVALQQCDAGRAIQLNTKTRTYLEMPFDKPAAPAQAGEKHKGGQITYTTTVVDTKETRPQFGFTARHVKTTILKDASADACDKRSEQVEIDGWYIDLPATTTCTGAPPAASEVRVDPNDASCRDEVKYVRPAESAGYPLAYTMTTTAGGDPAVTTAMETTKLERTSEDPQQFEIPADYIAVKTVAQLTADHRPGEDGPKKPGTIRIGVAPLANKSDREIATADLAQALAESLGEVAPDVVLLRGDTASARATEAQTRACDYILENTVAEVKAPRKGIVGKLSGTPTEGLTAKVDFALVAPGQPKPAYVGSEKSGGSMLETAKGAARRISRIVLPLMMGRFDYMSAFMTMGGQASTGAMQQTSDPVLSSVFALVDRATAPKSVPQAYTTEQSAVAAALEKEVASVATQLKRGKP